MNLPEFILVTKAWPMPLERVAQKVQALGLDGVELPVRQKGEPDDA